MQISRIQTLSRQIGAPSRSHPSPVGRRGRARAIKVKQAGSFPFDLSSMKDIQEAQKIGFFDRLEHLLFPKEVKEETPLPKLEEFMRPNPAGRFPKEPLHLPFPNPFTPPRYSSPLLLRTTSTPDSPPEEIKDPILKKLRLLFCMKGRLVKGKKGLYFIKLPDQILGTLLPFIKKIGADIPSHFMLIDNIGAHIPVIMPHETLDFGKSPDEVGETFYFAITGIYAKEVNNYPGISKVFYISFTSYDLEWLRQKHGLTSSLAGESFHCIIGTKKASKQKPVQETFRVSPLAQSA